MNRYEGRTVVVTGGASGIGEAIVRRIVAEGGVVWILDTQPGKGEALAEELGAKDAGVDGGGGGGRGQVRVRVAACDVADPVAVGAVFEGIPRVDALINSAGIAHIGTVLSTEPSDMDRLFAVNVKGVHHTMRAVIPKMRAAGGGAILNLASIAARVGISERFAYSMTKGAVLAMTLSVARDFVSDKIRSNCICPARVHTPFVDGFLEKHYPDTKAEMFARLSAYQPVGRMGRPDEIAGLAAYLCSDEAAFVTGAAYDIDGGVMTLR